MKARINGAPTLESDRLLLRPWRDEDVRDWVAMNADPRVMQFFPSTYEVDYATKMAQTLRERLEADGYGWWVLEAKNVSPFVGVIVLQSVPFEAAFTPAFEVGWRLKAEHWGRGYATEGATLAVRFAFDVLNVDEVVAMTAVQNLPSQRVMERLGMTHDARDDFDHPRLEEADRLRRHVLWRLSRSTKLPMGNPGSK
jgi:RimJ/RimL family protein N-acetyltransferase